MAEDWRGYWDFLRPCYNHGSFGATPTHILRRMEEEERKIDRDRMAFVWEGGFGRVAASKKRLTDFVGCAADDMVFTTNITESLSSVVRSLPLGAGDKVLMTSHGYPNYAPMVQEIARRAGFEVVIAPLPYPVTSGDEIVEAIVAEADDRVKLAVIDHVTSPTGLIFPIKKIVDALQGRGIDVFVDGAHAPGQVLLDIDAIGAAYYGGNNHKWICAPLSSGFLHVRKDRQARIIPSVGSADAVETCSFPERFVWQGTINYAPRLLVGETIDYMASLHPDGWDGIRRRNHDLALEARALLMARLGIETTCADDMIGTMFTLPLPPLDFGALQAEKGLFGALYQTCVDEYGFGVYSKENDGLNLLRVSAHLYNRIEDYQVLADVLGTVVERFSAR